METKKGYNTWAATYDSMVNKTRDLEAEVLMSVLSGKEFESVLELGCGTGKNTGFLASISEKVTAVDFSEEMIKVATGKDFPDHVSFHQADIKKPWNSETSDLITASLILEHIKDLRFIFSEAAINLQPGGLFYICELHPFKQLQGSRAKFECGDSVIELNYYVHHLSEFFQAATRSGFSCLDLNEWFDKNDKGIPRLCSFLFQLNK